MSRSIRTVLAGIGILVVLAGLGYAVYTIDLVGIIARAHTPPQH